MDISIQNLPSAKTKSPALFAFCFGLILSLSQPLSTLLLFSSLHPPLSVEELTCLQKFGVCSPDKSCSRLDKYRHFSWSASTPQKNKERRNSRINKVVSSSNLLSDKHSIQNTLNFHYIALYTKRPIHAHMVAHAHTHTHTHTHSTTQPIVMLTAISW